MSQKLKSKVLFGKKEKKKNSASSTETFCTFMKCYILSVTLMLLNNVSLENETVKLV